ncbi:MAG: azurin [Pseudomonadota bacterium]
MFKRIFAAAIVTAMASPALADDCAIEIEVGDALAYNTTAISTKASCGTVTVTLKHTGAMAANMMGHNFVLTKPGDFDAVTGAAITAGPDKNYVPDSDKVLASTKLIGGGESTSVEVNVEKLGAGEYTFFCSFPGHWAIMKGTFTVS